MKKQDELTDPSSCLSRARDDEFIFVLRAHDPAAPSAIRRWADMRINLGKNKLTDPEIQSALACARDMEDAREIERANAERQFDLHPMVP